jgi:hypothetical protein
VSLAWSTKIQRIRRYQQFAARCLQEARSTTDLRLKALFGEMAQEWQRLVDERKGSKSEHMHFQRHEVDLGD